MQANEKLLIFFAVWEITCNQVRKDENWTTKGQEYVDAAPGIIIWGTGSKSSPPFYLFFLELLCEIQ